MCGHFGIFGQTNQRLLNAFEDGLILNTVRGYHSTGVAFIDRKNKVSIMKDVVLPHKLMRRPEWNKHIGSDLIGIIGHGRAATKGKVTKENAHPFQHGNITLAHNGTIMDFDRKKLPDHEKFEVDSENICHAINKLGIEAAWKCIDGAAVLVYFDSTDASLNIISNRQRPFEFAWVNGGHAIMWSSEVNFLKAAMERNNIESSTKEDSFVVTSNCLYSFHVGRKGGLQYSTEDLEPFREPVVPVRSVGEKWRNIGGKMVQVDTYGRPLESDGRDGLNRWLAENDGVSGFDEGYGDSWPGAGGNDSSVGAVLGTPSVSDTTQANKVLPFRPMHVASSTSTVSNGISKGGLNEEAFNRVYKDCIFCHGKLDFLKCTVIDDEVAACRECAELAANSRVPLEKQPEKAVAGGEIPVVSAC